MRRLCSVCLLLWAKLPAVRSWPMPRRLSCARLQALRYAFRCRRPFSALFIPTPNSGGVTDGTLPDAPDISFRKDGPAGTLRLTAKAADGSDVVVTAQNRKGLYFDIVTDKPIGRDLDGQLYLDSKSVREAVRAGLAPGQAIAPGARSEADDPEPQLCPDPEADHPHGSSERAEQFEDLVHGRVNPSAPLPHGFAVRIKDPVTGKWLFPDDCFRTHGDLVDGDMKPGDFASAKGPGYAQLLNIKNPEKVKAIVEVIDQTKKYSRAAAVRGASVKVYFAEEAAAGFFKERFEREGLKNVVVGTIPPSKLKPEQKQ